MKCISKRTGEEIASQIELASTFWTRLKGLMFRRELSTGRALLLEPCSQIHTCFMRFPIDVVFLDAQNCVVGVIEAIEPWRISKFYYTARRTLELSSGALRGRVHIGDELILC